ncbi:MAG: outer membrane beta-barrel protein [Bdellovibrionaceae bacterium]|nr:outer membrane beta-barrel protein [Pseudobdellovibrionaceae bacterium]
MKKYISLMILFLSVQSHAGFIAEPFVGYNSGSSKATTISGTLASSTSSGFDYGIRAGFLFGQSFWIAGEYTGGSGKDKDSSSETDYTRTAIGVVIGYKLPNKYNFWLGYGTSDKITYKDSTTEIYTSGTNAKFGFGYEVAKNVDVNVELIVPKYSKFGNSTTEVDISSAFSKYDVSFALISLSFPFGFSK